jgi:glycosyltransferase involved in cell wall biosynthesis
MPDPVQKIALVYDDDAYVELLERRTDRPPDAAAGLMGRQVAGNEFLDAYFRYGRWDEMVALVFGQASRESLAQRFKAHPSTANTRRQLRIIGRNLFHSRFFPTAPAPVLHFPCPPDVRYAWARAAAGPGAFALSGLTHTISTLNVMRGLCDYVTAPVEPFDMLICISRAAVEVCRTVTGNYAAELNDHFGGDHKLRMRLAHVPLGVNSERFSPASDEQRRRQRQTMGIADDATVVLFVGRLTFTGKVHPFPIYAALQQASIATGKPVHLVMSGWAASDQVLKIMQDGAAAFAPGVKVTIVDGTKPEYRRPVWDCADIFTSLTDNIQETLSQVVIEAMACGLPVVASDWDGCRDQVVDGETGLLVPSHMVRGAGIDLTSRHLIEEMNYGFFLADCNQTVSIDVSAAAEAFGRLIADAALRQRMGQAGRERAVDHFNWAGVVHAYEALWAEQETERLAWLARHPPGPRSNRAPAPFPPAEYSFASYPKIMLETDDRVTAAPGAADQLKLALATALSSYRPENRCVDPAILASAVDAAGAGCSIGELDAIFAKSGLSMPAGRSTVAWMLKYDILRAGRK